MQLFPLGVFRVACFMKIRAVNVAFSKPQNKHLLLFRLAFDWTTTNLQHTVPAA